MFTAIAVLPGRTEHYSTVACSILVLTFADTKVAIKKVLFLSNQSSEHLIVKSSH